VTFYEKTLSSSPEEAHRYQKALWKKLEEKDREAE